MKNLIALCLYFVLSSALFAGDWYSFDSENVTISADKNIRSYHDIVAYYENRYDISLGIDEIIFTDSQDNNILMLEVDIITDMPSQELFSGPVHSSLLIVDIELNLLQPKLHRSEWNIYAIILKLNGVFLNKLPYDMTYNPVITRSMLYPMIYKD
jgi:hypothetical protein